jgi:sialic acid synthase SpsE
MINLNLERGVFIVAELSANHNGSLEFAIESIRAAKEVVLMLLNFKLISQKQLQ